MTTATSPRHSRALKVIARVSLVAVLAAGVLTIVRLRQTTARLAAEVAELRRHADSLVRVEAENRQFRDTAALIGQRDDPAAARELRAALHDARREVADLEQEAQRRRTALDARVVALDVNRDPTRGLTRLEHFQNAGRGTPAAAFQTLVWAALKGDEVALIDAVAVTGTARDRAKALLARLPEAGRERHRTPEGLAAIAVTAEILKGGALEIVGHALSDPLHARVTLRTNGSDRERTLPMSLGAGGWQLVVPPEVIDAIERRMAESTGEREPKK